jgi:hypothetical protein
MSFEPEQIRVDALKVGDRVYERDGASLTIKSIKNKGRKLVLTFERYGILRGDITARLDPLSYVRGLQS